MNDFEKIVRKLSPTMKRIAHRLNGHHSFFDEDDLYQEAVGQLWIAFEHGKLKDKTDSYVLQGCYFHLKNYMRKALDKAETISLNVIVGDGDTTLEETLPGPISLESDKSAESSLLDAAYSSGLSERERSVFSLLTEGLTVREIGKKLGISHVMVVKIKGGIRKKCSSLGNYLKKGYHN